MPWTTPKSEIKKLFGSERFKPAEGGQQDPVVNLASVLLLELAGLEPPSLPEQGGEAEVPQQPAD